MTQRQPVDTAAALLEATMRELDERGFAGVSLRAVARRAGVSHAAPKYFYGDRAGLMSAAAAVGFRELARRVRSAATGDMPLAGAGNAYVDLAMDKPALFDLMFRPSELDNSDADLNAARGDALASLNVIVDPQAASRGHVSDATLATWSFAHGVAVLARDGALTQATAPDREPSAIIARRLLATAAPALLRAANEGRSAD